MILREQTCVAATTEQVWAILTDPGLMSLWNPHCVRFVLQPVHGGTDILHIADFSHAGLPWFLKAIMKVMHRFGRKEGKSPLDGLKELAEGSDA